MNHKLSKILHLIFDILVSILLVIAGICLMGACIYIYRSGDKPFTPESVANAFGYIAIPVYLSIAAVAWNLILEVMIPRVRKKVTPKKQYGVILARLYGQKDIAACEPQLKKAITRRKNLRRGLTALSIGVLVLCCLVFFSYAVNPLHFDKTDITGSMIRAMYIMAPCGILPLCLGIVTVFVNRKRMQSEIELLKWTPTLSDPQVVTKKRSGKYIPAVRIAILCLAVVILVGGFLLGGTGDVLTKAVNICTECVGLG